MYFSKKYIIFLSLYFGFTLCFHNNIQTNYKFLQNPFSKLPSDCTPGFFRNLYESILPDISQGDPFSDITLPNSDGFACGVSSYSCDLHNDTNNVPLNLPILNDKDKMTLAAGGMIQKQHRDGYRGSGLVVVDIKSSPDGVFDTLTQFAAYQDMIPIVKSSKIVSSDGINTIAEFTLSKFLLRANIKHSVSKDHRIIKFILDPDRVNMVFTEAEGYWHVEVPLDRPEGYCRVYLSAQVVADKMVPSLILDYAVSRALSRATQWLKPFFL